MLGRLDCGWTDRGRRVLGLLWKTLCTLFNACAARVTSRTPQSQRAGSSQASQWHARCRARLRENPTRGTRHGCAATRVTIPGESHFHGFARPRRDSARASRVHGALHVRLHRRDMDLHGALRPDPQFSQTPFGGDALLRAARGSRRAFDRARPELGSGGGRFVDFASPAGVVCPRSQPLIERRAALHRAIMGGTRVARHNDVRGVRKNHVRIARKNHVRSR
jgi:hypothetical protein